MTLSKINSILKDNQIKKVLNNKYINITTTNRKIFGGGILLIFLMSLILSHTGAYLSKDVPSGTILYIVSIVMVVFSAVMILFKSEFPQKIETILTMIGIFTLPLITMALVECLNGVFIINWVPSNFILNCLFYSLLYLMIFTISGSKRLPFLIVNPILFLIAFINHYVKKFKGTPFVPMDLFSANTAANVTSSYSFTLDYQVILSTVLLIFTLIIATKIKTKKKTIFKKIITRMIAGILSFGILISYYTSDFLADAGLKPFFFNQKVAYETSGVALNFWMNTKYLIVNKPTGYDPNEIKQIVFNTIIEESDETTIVTPPEKKPNIICIMNESLSDLSILGDLKTNKDYMPYLRNLITNTVKGNLYVPVIGGGTSNVEYEFLTGASTTFIPSAANVYTLYLKDKAYSLTSNLKKQSYNATAFHPYNKTNWNRVNVYDNMEFDTFISIETLSINEELLTEGTSIFYRNYISDSYNYKELIKMYEQREKNKPFYIFNITMQNHGGYNRKHADFKEEIYLIDKQGNPRMDYPETNQYLSLIYESDKAFKELIEYFEKEDEPTIICMFGDHQPSIEDELIEELRNSTGTKSTLQKTQDRYVTPFYIWANYDIQEQQIDKLSVNYLSSYLLDIAGLEKTEYNKYLLSLSRKLPVIDTVGYIDANNHYYTYEQKTVYSKIIKDYEKICYNYLFDKKNKCNWLFSLK